MIPTRMESNGEGLEKGIESLWADVARLCSYFQSLLTVPTPARVEACFTHPSMSKKLMDPPEPQFVEDAPDLLVHMHALEKASSKGRNELTYYGRLLSSFLSFDVSVLVLKFDGIGMGVQYCVYLKSGVGTSFEVKMR